ncbi:MAG TPA: ABC transporter permease subunit [Pirellulaceae bacterium]
MRQPISRYWQIGLGIISVVTLITSYGALAQFRQNAKRDLARGQLATVESQIQKVARQVADASLPREDSSEASPELDRLSNEQRRLEESAARLRRDIQQAVDRSVPTWRSLYRDGLLRALGPEGLNKDEYWLWEDALASFRRLAAGLLVGVSLSVLLGLAMGCYSPIEHLLLPPISFLAKIAPTAMLAVFFILVGTGFEMYITMIACGTLPSLAQSVYQSTRADVHDELIDKAETLGASQMELVCSLILPQILPRLLDAARLQIGPAMVLLVAAEWMVADEGFGYRLRLFFQRTDMTVVYVYLIVLGAAGWILDAIFLRFRRWLCPWFEG